MSIAAVMTSGPGSVFVDNRIHEQADALDLDLTNVASLHEELWIARASYTRRRTHDQDVSGLQCDRLRKDFDRGCNVENHVAGACTLNSLTIEPRLDLQSGSTRRQFVGRNKVWSECTGSIEVLPDRPLRRLRLIFPDRRIIEDRVASHETKSILSRHVATSLAEERHEL